MNKISVVINTLNAERILEHCLESVKDAYEIILCDMYSNDRTIEIAKNYNCKIFFHERTGIVEPARNFAMDQATGEWILVLDADEIVTAELWQLLVNYSNNPIPNHLTCYIPRDTIVFGKKPVKERPCKRFWKKGNCYYSDAIHQAPYTREGEKHFFKGKNIRLIHYHIPSISSLMEKTDRYTDFELKRFEDKGRKFSRLMLLTRPGLEFLKYYFINGGVFNGLHGFIFCAMKGHYKFIQWAKLYEKEYKSRNKDLMY
jgi:glycosyltransferase involved in cell wall biosynthesis